MKNQSATAKMTFSTFAFLAFFCSFATAQVAQQDTVSTNPETPLASLPLGASFEVKQSISIGANDSYVFFHNGVKYTWAEYLSGAFSNSEPHCMIYKRQRVAIDLIGISATLAQTPVVTNVGTVHNRSATDHSLAQTEVRLILESDAGDSMHSIYCLTPRGRQATLADFDTAFGDFAKMTLP